MEARIVTRFSGLETSVGDIKKTPSHINWLIIWGHHHWRSGIPDQRRFRTLIFPHPPQLPRWRGSFLRLGMADECGATTRIND
ncbi:hypothetical protein R2G56_08155 [Nitratireductor aquimarinus]|uniref:Uncharacterized protein n=1 Tax=Nitratireductor aquimarinus TaxID=889300 RepID=A0ABU4AJ32_9HYPH|nr:MULTISPECIES: hypothetical protein [Nitratireductor]MCV0381435.1 hypothetical protein [Nitratireductor sp.]MDV6226255.1 hypothetical protein [Nitratireductor aquimarinus]